MSYLVDTNILLRIGKNNGTLHIVTPNALFILKRRNEELCIIAQNLIEFWVVATRPQIYNSLGLSVDEASVESQRLKSIFKLLPDTPTLFAEWESLVTQHRVIGKQAHDARLVAAMRTHNLTHILTFNTNDFKRFNDITAINPRNIN